MNNYYPFGLSFNSYQRVTAKENKYLFNGIERQTDLNLGWDLAEFRSYSPEIGRWHQIDPKASERESPYVGFANNPVLNVDPLGDTAIAYHDPSDGQITYITNPVVFVGEKESDGSVNSSNAMMFNTVGTVPPSSSDKDSNSRRFGVYFTGSGGDVQNKSNNETVENSITINIDEAELFFLAMGHKRIGKPRPAKNRTGQTEGPTLTEIGKGQAADTPAPEILEGLPAASSHIIYNGDSTKGRTRLNDSTDLVTYYKWNYGSLKYDEYRKDTIRIRKR